MCQLLSYSKIDKISMSIQNKHIPLSVTVKHYALQHYITLLLKVMATLKTWLS